MGELGFQLEVRMQYLLFSFFGRENSRDNFVWFSNTVKLVEK